MSTRVLSVGDGPATTVSTLIGRPTMVPARILDLLKNNFIAEALLRNAGRSTNGLVEYFESTPLYLGSDVEDVGEFGEIPVGAGSIGLPRIAFGTKKGLGVRVSREMRDENKIDAVNIQIRQLANTMIRAEEKVVQRLLTNPAIPTIAAGAAWDTINGNPRRDIANAMEEVGSALPDDSQDDDLLGFEADTVAMSGSLTPVLMDNEKFVQVYRDALAPESIAYTGVLPREILGLTGLKSRSWPKDKVLVLERGTVGFYSDTRPLESTGLYPEGNGPNGGPTESWRSDTTRKRTYGVDQPKAACWITGVVTP